MKIFTLLVWFLTASISYSQGLLSEVRLSMGASIVQQDKRLFDYGMKESLLRNEKSSNDFQFEILLNKQILSKNRFSVFAGIGYEQYISRFSRPFNHVYFTGSASFELRHIDKYFIHYIRTSSLLQYQLGKELKSKFSFVMPIGLKFGINKSVKGTIGTFNRDKWKFEFSDFDISGGLRYETGKLSWIVSYRILDLHKIDRVIFNEIIVNDIQNPILRNKYEFLNINAIKLNVFYNL